MQGVLLDGPRPCVPRGPDRPWGTVSEGTRPGSGGWHGRGASLPSKAGDGARLLSECAGLPGGPVTSPRRDGGRPAAWCGGAGGGRPHLRHGIGYLSWSLDRPGDYEPQCAQRVCSGGRGGRHRQVSATELEVSASRVIVELGCGWRVGRCWNRLGVQRPHTQPGSTPHAAVFRGRAYKSTSGDPAYRTPHPSFCSSATLYFHALTVKPSNTLAVQLNFIFPPLTDILQGKYLQNFPIPDRMPTESEFSSYALESCHAGALGSCTFTKAPFVCIEIDSFPRVFASEKKKKVSFPPTLGLSSGPAVPERWHSPNQGLARRRTRVAGCPRLSPIYDRQISAVARPLGGSWAVRACMSECVNSEDPVGGFFPPGLPQRFSNTGRNEPRSFKLTILCPSRRLLAL